MAGDLIPQLPGMVETLCNIGEWAANSAGWAAGKSGEIVSTVLFKSWVDDLRERIRKGQQEGVINEDFERSRHGQALLAEALNALWQARDQERAEAIQQVFLGLAMNPVEESLEQVEQLQIVRTAAEMTTWEVMFCHVLERYSKLAFQRDLAENYGPWEQASNPELGRARISELQGLIQAKVPHFLEWFNNEHCKGREAAKTYLRRAADSLNQKLVLKVSFQGLEENRTWRALDKRGAFTEHGWKLAQYLYEAKTPTEVESKGEPK